MKVFQAGVSNGVEAYQLHRRLLFAAATIACAVLVAGFWNSQLVDGFGRDVVAARTIGDPTALSTSFSEYGFGFGFLFGAVAGLAATFTACNCVVFAMLPGLTCSRDGSSRISALRALTVFTVGVLGVGAAYGLYVGSLGPTEIASYNEESVRLLQANRLFTVIGLVMVSWGLFELGLVGCRVSPAVRAWLAKTTTKAGILGVLVGAFAIGRPFPVMRDLLVYAASAGSPVYAAAVMMAQGLGQIALMVTLFLALVYGFRRGLARWVATRPQQVALVNALALIAGGAFFVFYWGLAFAFDIGRWGFQLGWY
jgi:sulfite exporter TauE/SafE